MRIVYASCASMYPIVTCAIRMQAQFSAELWARLKLSSFWTCLNFTRQESAAISAETRARFNAALSTLPLRPVEEESGKVTYVPFPVKPCLNQDQLISDLVRQGAMWSWHFRAAGFGDSANVLA